MNNTNTEQTPLFTLGGTGRINILDAITIEPPELDFVIPGLLAGTVGVLAGSGGTGKSMFSLMLHADLATGKDCLGLGIEKTDSKTLYLTIEDPREVLHHRMYNLGKHFEADEIVQIDAFFDLESQSGSVLHLVNERGEINYPLMQAIIQQVKQKRYRLITCDTMRRFHGADENLSGPMSSLLSCFEHIAKESGAAVLLIHHMNKGAVLNGKGTDAGALRGSSAITDNIRAQFNLMVMTPEQADDFNISESERHKYLTFTDAKSNYKEKNVNHWLKRTEGGIIIKQNWEENESCRSVRKFGRG